MRRKNITTETPDGTPFHMVVFPSNRALRVTAKENPKTAHEKSTRTQKRALAAPDRGGSLESIGCPVTFEKNIWTK